MSDITRAGDPLPPRWQAETETDVFPAPDKWETGDDQIDVPKPFAMRIAWEDLAF